jgi:AcrR family transcriptional regulator
MNIELTGTKERLFDIAVRLISKDGFENVSMRDIANETGIKAASIYNHFSSKEEILDTIYRYYSVHRLDDRNSTECIKTTIEKGSAFEIVKVLSDIDFDREETMGVRLILISKIILMRIFKDQKANQFFLHEWYETDIEHLKKWLGYAVEIGRVEKTFDIDNFAVFFWRQTVMMGIWAFANHEIKIPNEEKNLFDMFASLLPLKESLLKEPFLRESL